MTDLDKKALTVDTFLNSTSHEIALTNRTFRYLEILRKYFTDSSWSDVFIEVTIKTAPRLWGSSFGTTASNYLTSISTVSTFSTTSFSSLAQYNLSETDKLILVLDNGYSVIVLVSIYPDGECNIVMVLLNDLNVIISDSYVSFSANEADDSTVFCEKAGNLLLNLLFDFRT